MARIGAVSASVAAMEPISGQSRMARPQMSHGATPTVNAAVAGSDSARLLLAHDLERLRQPAHGGERGAERAGEADPAGKQHGPCHSRDSTLL